MPYVRYSTEKAAPKRERLFMILIFSLGNLYDLVGHLAVGNGNIDFLTRFATQQRLAQRRLVGNHPLIWVGLRRAYDGVLLRAVLQLHMNRGTERYRGAALGLNKLGVLEDVLNLRNTAFNETLLIAGSVVG